MNKRSEGGITKLVDWTFDSLSEDRYEEIMKLQSLSLLFQSLLYAEIARNFIPF
jgi:hypothetical protein